MRQRRWCAREGELGRRWGELRPESAAVKQHARWKYIMAARCKSW